MGVSERLKTCYRIHWNGFFFLLSPLALLPMAFLEPGLQWRSIFILLWAFIWYLVEAAPVAATAILPIIAIPLIGVMDSNDICSCFARESNMLFLLCNFIAVTFQHCNIVKLKSFFILNHMSCDPRKILLILMVFSYTLTAFLPASFVCALMMPTVKVLLQHLNDMNVCKAINDEAILKDDEEPYPSKVAIAFYTGVAYAVNIGSITMALSSDSGLSLRHLINTEPSLSQMNDGLQLKYLMFSLPVSLLLLIFTIFYLEIIFLGFLRSTSSSSQQFTIDKEASKAALEVVANDLPPFNVHMFLVAALFFGSVVGVVVCSIVGPKVDNKVIKYSANAMMLCFFYFVLPRHLDFLNYFRCTAPKEYKTTPSILPWAAIHKFTPWRTFLVHGSSVAFGMLIKITHLHVFIGDGLLFVENPIAKQLGFIALTTVFTAMASNNLVADVMLNMGLKAAAENPATPFLYPITWASCLTFLLPVSSSANCFAMGWGNIRAKHMILAAIGPTLLGLLLVFLMGLIL